MENSELQDRLKLIETMMEEGRKSTQSWGWSFLLWGLGPLLAMWWTDRWPHAAWAWPVTMGLCILINGLVLAARKRRGISKTTTSRALAAVWRCAGATVLLLACGAVWSGAIELRALYVALFALAAVAHGTSSLILRWWPQFLAALVWWVAGALAFVVPAAELQWLAVLALVLANVVFGGWLTYREWSGKDA